MVSFSNLFPNYIMSNIFDEEATVVPATEGDVVAAPEVEAAPAATEDVIAAA